MVNKKQILTTVNLISVRIKNVYSSVYRLNSGCSQQLLGEVNPVRIGYFNEIDFPLPPPFLHCLFALDCKLHVFKIFPPDKVTNVVFRCKSLGLFLLVLNKSSWEITGHANIQGSILFARHDVDRIDALLLGHHRSLA